MYSLVTQSLFFSLEKYCASALLLYSRWVPALSLAPQTRGREEGSGLHVPVCVGFGEGWA